MDAEALDREFRVVGFARIPDDTGILANPTTSDFDGDRLRVGSAGQSFDQSSATCHTDLH